MGRKKLSDVIVLVILFILIWKGIEHETRLRDLEPYRQAAIYAEQQERELIARIQKQVNQLVPLNPPIGASAATATNVIRTPRQLAEQERFNELVNRAARISR